MPSKRGKLKPQDEKVLQTNWVYLKTELDARFLVSDLYEKGVFTSDDKEKVLAQDTKGQRTETMLDILSNCGPDAYSVFLNILDAAYEHVANRLRATKISEEPVSHAWSWFYSLPEDLQNHVISEADASRFSACCGVHWYQIGLRLGMTSSQLELESVKQHNSPANISTAILIKWKQREVKGATIKAFMDVLKELEEDGVSTIDWATVQRVTERIVQLPK